MLVLLGGPFDKNFGWSSQHEIVDSVDNYYRVELGGRRNKAIGRFGYIYMVVIVVMVVSCFTVVLFLIVSSLFGA